MSLTNADRQKKWREQQRKAGLQQFKVYLHPDDVEVVREFAAKVIRKRQKLTKPVTP